MKKICVCECFAAVDFTYGGIEEFMVNMLQQFACPQLEYSVFVPGQVENEKLKIVSQTKNIEIITGDMKQHSGLLKKMLLFSAYKKFFKKHHFDVVHIHGGNIIELALVVMAAKKCGIKRIIIHSHNTGVSNFRNEIKRKISKRIFQKYVDQYLACSVAAAQWMFPDKVIQENKYIVINNGIVLNKFTFHPEVRKAYREEFELTNEFVVCNVGRFHPQKNHAFIVEIAKKLSAKNFNYKMILVGTGELKTEIVQKINNLHLDDKFIFLENRDDIAQIMMASDIFIFPSVFEGLGIVAIEAQATGLKTIVSTAVPQNVAVTDLVQFLPINDAQLWVDAIVNYTSAFNRSQYTNVVADAGYSAEASAKLLEDIYLA